MALASWRHTGVFNSVAPGLRALQPNAGSAQALRVRRLHRLALPPGQPVLGAEMTENFVQQLRVVLLGASAWKESSRARVSGA